MTETGLLAAQVAFLLLLLGFVWAVVRSSSRTVARAVPPPPPMNDPVDRPSDTAAHPRAVAVVATPEVAEPTPVAAPPLFDVPAPEPVETVSPPPDVLTQEPVWAPAEPAVPATAEELGTSRAREARERMDLAANIQPRLVVENSTALTDGSEVELAGGLTVGRSRSSDLQIDDAFVSHMHARILRRGHFYFVEDLGSTNGTFLNGQRVSGDAQLKVRDELRFGETVLRYEE
jgi:FHA domain